MKFLCLPGTYGSAKNFGVQLSPFARELEKRSLATFTFTQGKHEAEPPLGWENYFGSRPLFRFLDPKHGDGFEVLRRARRIPRGLSPEGTIRLFECGTGNFDVNIVRDALDAILQLITDDPEIDGILGFSEGAMLAASVLLAEQRRWEEDGTPRRIKFGIFFSGAPPLSIDEDNSSFKLSDEISTAITIPTLHVIGSSDPLLYSSVALYNVCDPETAILYDHGLGHLVPRDAESVRELADIVGEIVSQVDILT
ncbi:hypothetical protein Q7P37_008259 [Cladosporium fusiforme]